VWESIENQRPGLQCYSIEGSVALAIDFLHYQFNHSEEQVKEFLETLSKLLNREMKKNFIDIVSRP
jgi:hypothetical protein